MSKQHYGVYGQNESIEISEVDIQAVWNDLQAVPSYMERYVGVHPVDCLCWKCATSEMAALPVIMEDEVRHTDDTPFCGDPECPCHHDDAYFDEHIARPYREGRLKLWEAQELLWPER